MKKGTKLIYSVFSIAPIGLWILFEFVSPLIPQSNSTSDLFTFWELYPGLLGKLRIGAIVVGLLFSIYMSVKVFQNNFVPEPKKNLWGIILILGNVIVLPLFWFNYIRTINVSN